MEKVCPRAGKMQKKQRKRQQPKEVRQQGGRTGRLRQATGIAERLSKEESARAVANADASSRKRSGIAEQRNPDPREPKERRRRNPEPTTQSKQARKPRVA